MQQHGETQNHDQKLDLEMPRRAQILEFFEMNLASVRADDAGQNFLLFLRKSRHIRVLKQIGAVLVIVRVRHIEANFVQSLRPRT